MQETDVRLIYTAACKEVNYDFPEIYIYIYICAFIALQVNKCTFILALASEPFCRVINRISK